MHFLSVRNLSKTYVDGTVALSDVHFDIRQGEVVALLGHNGSGKSTLFRSLVGLEQATSGTVRIDGVDIRSAKGRALRNVRTRVGLVFQKFNLIDNLTVFHNVLLGAMGRTRNPRNWLPLTASESERAKAMDGLRLVKLAHLAERRASMLSGGEQQRVAIARMLMQDPVMILADEPVASLDPKAGREVMELLLDIVRERGLTVVCILHQLEFALQYADRILGLSGGRLVLDKRVSEVERGHLDRLYGLGIDDGQAERARGAGDLEAGDNRLLAGGFV